MYTTTHNIVVAAEIISEAFDVDGVWYAEIMLKDADAGENADESFENAMAVMLRFFPSSFGTEEVVARIFEAIHC